MENAIRLGKPSIEEKPETTSCKIVLKDREEKANIFRNMRNLKVCGTLENTARYCFSHLLKRKIQSMIKEAKRKDKGEATKLWYTVIGSASQLKMQRSLKRESSLMENCWLGAAYKFFFYHFRSLFDLKKSNRLVDFIDQPNYDIKLLAVTWLTFDVKKHRFFPPRLQHWQSQSAT